jgi:hypothetical protein
MIDLIYTDDGLIEKGDELYLSSKGERYGIRRGNISPSVEKGRKEVRCSYQLKEFGRTCGGICP